MKKLKACYYIKKDKENKTGEAPIYCSIKVNGTKSTFSSGIYLKPDRWKKTNCLQTAKLSESERIKQSKLQNIKQEIEKFHLYLENSNEEIIANRIKELVLGDKITNKSEIISLCNKYIEKYKIKVNKKEGAKGTLEKYQRVTKHLRTFLTVKYGKEKYMIKEDDSALIFQFDSYLRYEHRNGNTTDVGICNNSTVKYVRSINTMLNDAQRHGFIKRNPYVIYNKRLNDVETVFLCDEELETIQNKDFGSNRLNTVKDIFLLCCYTGYAPCDIMKLTWSNIENDSGNLWVITSRQKTKVKSDVMLIPPALRIIENFKNDYRCTENNRLLPDYSNQKMNEYLKEIGTICKINKDLHWYISRHTFATTVTLGNGVSIENLSKMMGHKNIKQTQHYARVLKKSVEKDMIKLSEKYQ